MECEKCGCGMKRAQLLSGMHGLPVWLRRKKKGLLEPARESAVDCLVCPQCGHIELKAQQPERFRDIT